MKKKYQKLEQLKDQLRHLKTDLENLQKDIEAEKLRLAKEEYGVYVGCVIERRNALGEYQQCQVTKIVTRWFPTSPPWLYGQRRSLNGLFGGVIMDLGRDWNVLKEAE